MNASASLQSRFSGWLKDELRPPVLLKSLAAGLLIYILEVVITVSFAALIFSGKLADQLPYGLALILAANAVLGSVIALTSSYPGTIAVSQDIPSAILAITSASVVATLSGGGSPQQSFATVVVMIAGTSLVAGLFFVLLGVFKLGGLVRFLPYPVMGGFLAGTGWLLTTGGLGVLVGGPLNLDMFQSSLLLRWLPGLILGVILLFAAIRIKSPLALPGLLAGAVVAFYAVAWAANTPLARLSAEGWLLGPFPSDSPWQFPFSGEILSQVNWSALLGQIPALAPVLIVGVIAFLLNANGIELIIKKDINLNRELVITGVANLFAGSLGGIVGYHGISVSNLNHLMSGGKRLTGLFTGFFMGLTLFVGVSALAYLPKMLLGALLIFLGLALLYEWVYRAWFKFSRIDFAIILLVLGVIAVRGFLEGIAIGLVLTIILFVVSYSQISVVKHALSAASYRSRVDRSPRQQTIIEAHGEQLYVLKLQGFIFFGTANGLFEKVQARSRAADRQTVRFVLLDFAQVTGLDSTGLLSFSRMRQLAQEKGIILVLTGLSGRVREQFIRGGFHEQPGTLRFFPDLDHGVEFCEDEIVLANPGDEKTLMGRSLQQQLEDIVPMPKQIDQLIRHMEKREIVPGEYLIRQGDDPDALFFIESGQVTAQLESPGQEPMRLETTQGGRTVGEIAFYLGIKRTAAVIADEPSVVYALSREALEHIEKTDAEAASAFHRLIVHILGERVVRLTRALDALER